MANDETRPNVQETMDRVLRSGTKSSPENRESKDAHVRRLQKELKKVKRQLAAAERRDNKPNVALSVSGGSISTRKITRVDGVEYKTDPTSARLFDPSLAGLSKVIGDLLYVGRSAARGNDIMVRRPEKTKQNGKTETAKNADGHDLYHPTRMDGVIATFRLLEKNEATRKALQEISDFVSSPEFQADIQRMLQPDPHPTVGIHDLFPLGMPSTVDPITLQADGESGHHDDNSPHQEEDLPPLSS